MLGRPFPALNPVLPTLCAGTLAGFSVFYAFSHPRA
jgi:hypothetical protein